MFQNSGFFKCIALQTKSAGFASLTVGEFRSIYIYIYIYIYMNIYIYVYIHYIYIYTHKGMASIKCRRVFFCNKKRGGGYWKNMK